MQKYDLKRSQSGIPHGQTASKDHNLVFRTDKRPQKIIIQYSTQTNDITNYITHYPMQKYDLKRSLVFCMDKRPQKIIIWYSTQKNDLTKVITHYPTQKYDLKRSQSGILHGQTTSKDHNPVIPNRQTTSQRS